MARNTLTKGWWSTIKKALLIIFFVQLFYILMLKWVYPPTTITQIVNWAEGYGLTRDYVQLDEISPHLLLAVIAAADQRFPDHHGFDWQSIEKAYEQNKQRPDRIRGASTISQQVAKNVFLWQGRSWVRKALEVYFTFMIELVWGKQRILEVYVNVVEMGRGVFGAQAASRYYFNKDAKALTRHEAALVAAVLPNPKVYPVRKPSKFMSRRAAWIERQMANLTGDAELQALIYTGKD